MRILGLWQTGMFSFYSENCNREERKVEDESSKGMGRD
jgi:hypothetical protein